MDSVSGQQVHHHRKFISLHSGNEPNAIFIQEPVIIIGDIHGQFYDLLKILSLCPSMETEPKEHLLFLGDYVDRGPMGIEVLILVMAMKVKYPKKVIMLRGNHETRLITQTFTFLSETIQKYDQKLYFHLMDAFDALPLVCIVNNNLFCVHGGITKTA
jgi:predicted MPP superfamily phosphohydrolase